MGVKHPYQIINPPNLLKAKVGGDLSHDEALVKRAEDALEELSEDYAEWLERDLADLSRLLDEVKGDPEAAGPGLEEMARRAHDVKGQAGTFGYPLITALAESLCNLLSRLDGLNTSCLEVMTTHVEAMEVVRRDGIRGEGGAPGRELVVGVRKAVERVVA